MNNFHFRKIKQLKDWKRDLNAVLTFKSNEMDDETRKDTTRYRNLLVYAIEQAERVQKLEQWGFETKPYIKSLEQQNKRYREAIEFGIEYLKNSDIRQVQLVVTALKSALEGDSDE